MKNKTAFAALLAVVVIFAAGQATAQETGFPYDRELLLDTRPMPGSKRIPNMDIAASGAIALEMWCNRVEGQAVVAGDTVTIITGQRSIRSCPPERTLADAELLEALSAVTHWRRQGDGVELIGSKTLRFKVPTN